MTSRLAIAGQLSRRFGSRIDHSTLAKAEERGDLPRFGSVAGQVYINAALTFFGARHAGATPREIRSGIVALGGTMNHPFLARIAGLQRERGLDIRDAALLAEQQAPAEATSYKESWTQGSAAYLARESHERAAALREPAPPPANVDPELAEVLAIAKEDGVCFGEAMCRWEARNPARYAAYRMSSTRGTPEFAARELARTGGK
jgi:hypothetical protein